LIAAVLIVFGRSLSFDLIDWDDQRHILHNPFVNPPSIRGLLHHWTAPYDRLYIPLSYTWFAVETWLARLLGFGRPVAAVYHAFSLFMHAGCSWLVFLLLRRLVKHELAALFGALLFAVHPLQVESVAWVSEQRGLLAALLSLSAIHLILPCDDTATVTPREGRRRYALATLLFTLSLLAKPSTVVVPLLVVLLLCGWFRQPWRQSLLTMLPWIGISAVMILATKWQQSSDSLAFQVPFWQRPLIAGDALAWYFSKLVWPVELGFDPGRRPQVVLASAWVDWAWLVAAGVTVVAALLPRRRTWLVSLAWMFIALAPVLGFVSFLFQDISTVADRYMYIPMIGVAWALAAALASRGVGAVAVSIVGAALGMLALVSFEQAGYWKDSVTLFEHGLEVNPNSFTAYYDLGAKALREGRRLRAEEFLRRCLDIEPNYAWAHNTLGVVLAERGNSAAAIDEYRRALAIDPRSADAHGNLANALMKLGERNEALAHYRQALELAPQRVMIRYNFASALGSMGRLVEAIEQFELAAAAPSNPLEPRVALATIYQQQGDWARAEAQWRIVVARHPQGTDAWLNLAQVLAAQNRRDEAVEIWRKALDQLPADSPQADEIRRKLGTRE
jgi:Tfp pilus assembly protein PilF